MKQKIAKFMGAVGFFFVSIFFAGFARAQQVLYGPPPARTSPLPVDSVQALYGVEFTPISAPLYQSILWLLIPLIVLVTIVVAIVLGIRAILRRRKKPTNEQ